MENNKYYTPELEEFCVGFEFEQYDTWGSWRKFLLTENLLNQRDIAIGSGNERQRYWRNTRVRCLDKNDIEEVLGVKQLKGDDINLNFQILLDDSEDFYEINYDLDTKILNIELLKENEEGSHDTYTLFSYGVIKNKTEFKKLLNRLGIYGNTNNK